MKIQFGCKQTKFGAYLFADALNFAPIASNFLSQLANYLFTKKQKLEPSQYQW